jgi:hypothetical protein
MCIWAVSSLLISVNAFLTYWRIPWKPIQNDRACGCTKRIEWRFFV